MLRGVKKKIIIHPNNYCFLIVKKRFHLLTFFIFKKISNVSADHPKDNIGRSGKCGFMLAQEDA